MAGAVHQQALLRSSFSRSPAARQIVHSGSASRAVALPSRFEGFPNALCEAMACGVAVVAADCESGPRDIVTDGVDGILTPPEDVAALERALDGLMGDDGRGVGGVPF